jgi:hypothetical protein
MAARQKAIHTLCPAEARSDDGIDWGQLRAVLRLLLVQGLRRGGDAMQGDRGSPLGQIVFGTGIMGLFFSFNASFCADLESYLIILFLSTFINVSLGILPDTNDVRQRNIDLLHSKPISEKTLLASRAAELFFFACLIATGFSTIPFIAACLFFNCSPALIIGSYLMLLLGNFALVGVWMAAVLALSVRFNPDRVRMVCQITGLVVSMATLLVCTGFLFSGQSISLTSMAMVRALPSSWFATFLIDGFDQSAIFARAGVMLTLVGSARVMINSSFGRRYPAVIEKLNSSAERCERSPFSVRLIVKLRGVPLVGKRLVTPQSFGVTMLILTAIHREETSRVRMLAPRLMLAVFIALMVVTGDPSFFSFMIVYSAFMSLFDCLDLSTRSAHATASWVFGALPVSGREILRGFHLAVWVKSYGLHAYVIMACYFLLHPAMLALALTALNFILADAVISLCVLVAPKLPLSRDPFAFMSLLGYLVAIAPVAVSLIGYFTLTTLYSLSSVVSFAVAALALASMVGVSFGLRNLAARRLSAVES